MWSPINPFHRSTSQATTRSTTCSGILASVPRGALCTAGVAMLGSASSDYWLHATSHPNAAFLTKFMLKPCGAGPHHRFSPARVCSDDHFVCLALGLPHPTRFPTFLIHFSSIFIDFSMFRARCRRDNNPPHESFVESDSRARMSYHNHPKTHLHSIT